MRQVQPPQEVVQLPAPPWWPAQRVVALRAPCLLEDDVQPFQSSRASPRGCGFKHIHQEEGGEWGKQLRIVTHAPWWVPAVFPIPPRHIAGDSYVHPPIGNVCDAIYKQFLRSLRCRRSWQALLRCIARLVMVVISGEVDDNRTPTIGNASGSRILC